MSWNRRDWSACPAYRKTVNAQSWLTHPDRDTLSVLATNADSAIEFEVVTDLLRRFEQIVPWHDPADRHAEGNTAAHLRSVLVGTDVSIPVSDGRLDLGTWQGIFLAEFDGPRTRRVTVTVLRGV